MNKILNIAGTLLIVLSLSFTNLHAADVGHEYREGTLDAYIMDIHYSQKDASLLSQLVLGDPTDRSDVTTPSPFQTMAELLLKKGNKDWVIWNAINDDTNESEVMAFIGKDGTFFSIPNGCTYKQYSAWLDYFARNKVEDVGAPVEEDDAIPPDGDILQLGDTFDLDGKIFTIDDFFVHEEQRLNPPLIEGYNSVFTYKESPPDERFLVMQGSFTNETKNSVNPEYEMRAYLVYGDGYRYYAHFDILNAYGNFTGIGLSPLKTAPFWITVSLPIEVSQDATAPLMLEIYDGVSYKEGQQPIRVKLR